MNVEKDLATLQQMTTDELRERYAEIFGEEPRSRHKAYLIRKIAWRIQAEAFVASQKNEGWVCLPDQYDDGGFSGGNMDRPGIRQLMADIEAGHIDCVVVYKVDRLSRSLMDFAKLMGTFEEHNVSFASVTQQFNTTHSMGWMAPNVVPIATGQLNRNSPIGHARWKVRTITPSWNVAPRPPADLAFSKNLS